MSTEDVYIRDVSRVPGRDWVPPIGEMGGPASHVLYRDLVVHAGLRLLRDREGRPWLEMQDGGRRRTFPLPSADLRFALDRFRMRRNLRPVPESDLNDFVRVVEARISDPDIVIPLLGEPAKGSGSRRSSTEPSASSPPFPTVWDDGNGADPERRVGETAPKRPVKVHRFLDDSVPAPRDFSQDDSEAAPTHWFDPTISGGRTPQRATAGELPRYVRVFRDLTQSGGWLGTTAELARLMDEDPDTILAWLYRHRSVLLENNLVVTAVEVEDGWRWLAVDRGQLHPTGRTSGGAPFPGQERPETHGRRRGLIPPS